MNRKRIVIIGSGGRLGAALQREFAKEHDVTGFAHATLDIGSPEQVAAALQPLEFDVLVNCAALTNVDYCETNREEAFRINADAVADLARQCEGKQARMIHISTDYVFGGEQEGDLTEDDPAEAISVYGESKRAGEQRLLEVSDQHLAVRVSWVFGPDRPSFIDAMLQRALTTDKVEAIADKYSTPGFTIDYAEYMKPLLDHPDATGLLHLCNSGRCTWQEYAQHAIDCAKAAGAELRTDKAEPIRLADLKNFVARRPINTVLSTAKFTRLTGITPRPWQAAVEDYVKNYFLPALQKQS